jgi:hypothetical protein
MKQMALLTILVGLTGCSQPEPSYWDNLERTLKSPVTPTPVTFLLRQDFDRAQMDPRYKGDGFLLLATPKGEILAIDIREGFHVNGYDSEELERKLRNWLNH